eukprot:CAMPEP_0172380226 /NCGR_PEP_ID=MMETSP1060-20121228/70330_1 /TAXON_ID=37318 /ORGANISM="Pseudo-nitzschia pungens, Strain cf. cingulata" /LENGTH=1355 /DNA_ID=CAMNT_0013107977 /DNA_START=492 /DNA_END=4559 /DNA_ORIENTATION=-
MVVAEVPLWVVHSNANAPGSIAQKSGNDSNGNDNGNASNGATTGGVGSRERATESLRLWTIGSGGGGGTNGIGIGGVQRAAIYSIDFHGTKFATGGGDGTVRIWNAGALFPKPKSLIKSQFRRRETASTTTVNANANANANADGMDSTMQTTATTSHQNQYESSGESSQDDEGNSPSSSPESNKNNNNINKSNNNKSNNAHRTVRDLSSVVRRKGESAAPVSPSPAASDLPDATESDKNKTNNSNNNDSAAANAAASGTPLAGNHRHHRLLCTLSAHTGSSVLAVRFSNHGKYLASAGDDAVVCVYAKQSGSNSLVARGNLESNHLEHWIRIKLCRGHGLDAVGLAWAPGDSHLVSCSLDSNTPIAVWKFDDLASSDDDGHPHQHNYNNVLCHPYKILGKGVHTSTVKGVTFDPAGTYLASSGDDPSICIWRAHDDWGLERKIDASSGIFRRWNSSNNNSSSQVATTLSSQSLFRRLSWSTDGAYICATNAVVKNKHVASTVSREGWTVSGSKSAASGAVNLVGHKQPVVACRHCPYLLNNNNNHNDDDDDDNDNDGEDEHDNDGEPDYSTLLALGDKRGFVTVWSTRKSRPIFKIQCSETRCTVTDLAWGRCSRDTNHNHNNNNNNNSSSGNKSDGDLVLLVSLLDGQVVALRFGIPDEFGRLLSARDQARVFQLRYGIDLNDAGQRLGDPSGRPKLIENVLQFALEHETAREEEEEDDDDNDDDDENNASSNNNSNNRPEIAAANQQPMLTAAEIAKRQLESRSKGGKKRIQPLLMMQTTPLSAPPPSKKQKVGDKASKAKASADTLETALELAEKAASGAAAVTAAQKTAAKSGSAVAQTSVPQQHHQHQQYQHHQNHQHHLPQTIQLLAGAKSTPQIPHSTDRIHSVDLPLPSGSSQALANGETRLRYVADCTNSIRIPRGSSGSALPRTVLSISQGGKTMWNDQLMGSSCSSIAASESWLAVGTSDGCLQMYGTSPTMGWESASAFRSHPPLVVGRPIVALHLRENEKKNDSDTELLLVSSDGRFAVYGLEPRIQLRYKGSLLPAMTHMLLSADLETDLYLPKLARIQLTETNRLLLLLSLHSASTAQGRNPGAEEGRTGRTNQGPCVGAGGSLQGFIYDLPSELWMRVADSRFVLSDFYNSLPSCWSSSKKKASPKGGGPLSKLDDSVRMGAAASSLQRSRRSRSLLDHHPASILIASSSNNNTNNANASATNDVDSRSHCEDRMACALALGSVSEFEFWFSMYVKVLSLTGNESLLRLVIDMLLFGNRKQGGVGADADAGSPCQNGQASGDASGGISTCWWLSESPEVLGLDRVKLVKTVVIPEMSKNRALQRITNEIAVEVAMLSKE